MPADSGCGARVAELGRQNNFQPKVESSYPGEWCKDGPLWHGAMGTLYGSKPNLGVGPWHIAFILLCSYFIARAKFHMSD